MGEIHQLTQSAGEFADGLVKAAKDTPHAHPGAMGQAFLHAAVQLLVEQYGTELTRDSLRNIADNIMSFHANDADSSGPEAA